MGVAGLFAFLRRKYPEIVDACAQQVEAVAEGESSCEHLYIDLNHIIHACTHPTWRDVAHAGEEEQFMEIDLYLDRLVGLMRPTRLLLLAMDGVAPTAKMNQQRGRRFYAAHLERQKADIEAQVRREMAAELGTDGASAIADLQLPAFDGNVITPGTGFMARLSAHLRLFLEQKLACDPDWQHLAVVFSDSSEPGEGEHKILRFIRQQRTQPDYDPNTRHCIFGQDADLILLGLLSHEPHFCLLRESGRLEAVLEAADGEEEGEDAPFWSPVGQQPLELLRLSTLRDFLRCEFAEFVADTAEHQQQGRQQGQAGSPAPAGSAAGSGSDAEGGGGSGSSAGGSADGSPVGGSGLPPAAGSSTGGGSGRSSLDGNQPEGPEVDLITGEKKRVHPSVLRKLAKKAAKAQQAQQAAAQAEPSGSQGNEAGTAAAAAAAAAGGGGGGKGGARFDFERILDDVVCCTFLAGNDFVPQLPSLDIYDRPSALQTLLDKYKELLSSRRGYLTSGGRIDPDKLCWLFAQLAGEEVATFQARERRKVQEQRRKMHQEAAAAGGSGREGGPAGASWMGDGWVSMGELAPGQSLDEALTGMAWGGNPDVPTAAQFAGDPAALRRELSRRVRERMSDRADAGMAADPVRLAMPGYRGRFYTKCFDAPAPSGPELEQLVRRVCASFCRTLCWNLAYYCRGSLPVVPPSLQTADEGSPPGARNSKSSSSAAGSSGDTPYASWQVHYEYHYAPLASDLAKYGREALKGAAAAACRPHPPIQPFAQLCSVLPFSSMPTCLPPLLARVAEDPADGLAALHGAEAGDVFPQDVSALVDLSGKKWAHTAVVRLPFPDVDAISGFVREQLDSESCRLTDEERHRNEFAPALLLLPEGHSLASRLLQRMGGSGSGGSSSSGGDSGWEMPAATTAHEAAQEDGSAAAPAAEDAGASILSLLLPRSAADGGSSSSQPAAQMAGVVCWPLDLAGQDTPAFSAGLLPGTQEGEAAITLQRWNKRKLDQQRRAVERARQGGRGRGGRSDRGGSAFLGSTGGRGRGGPVLAPLPPPPAGRGFVPPPAPLPAVGAGASRVPPPVPLGPARVRPPVPLGAAATAAAPPLRSIPPVPLPPGLAQRRQQEFSDEELARQLQEQFDAEVRAAAAGGGTAAAAVAAAGQVAPPPGFGSWVPVPGQPSGFTAAGTPVSAPPGFGVSAASSASSSDWGAAQAYTAPPPAPSRSGHVSRSSSGSRGYWPTADAFVLAGSSWADEVEAEEAEEAAAAVAVGTAAPAVGSEAAAQPAPAAARGAEPQHAAARPQYAPLAAAAAAAAATEAAAAPAVLCAQTDDVSEDVDELMPWLATPARPAEEPAVAEATHADSTAPAAPAEVLATAVEEDEVEEAAVAAVGQSSLGDAGPVPAAEPAQQPGGPVAAPGAAAETPGLDANAVLTASAEQLLGPDGQDRAEALPAGLGIPSTQAERPAEPAAGAAAEGIVETAASEETPDAAAASQAEASALAELQDMLALLGMQ